MPNRMEEGFIFKAKVISVNPDDRLINVEWLNGKKPVFNVRVVTGSGDFSFPEMGDIGLVIGDEVTYYYLGKIDTQYRSKLKGEVKNKAGDTLKGKIITNGEAALANIAKGIWLTLGNSENFSLVNGLQEGIKFVKFIGLVPVRLMKVMAQTVSLLASGQVLNVGTVTRVITGQGAQIITDPQIPTQGALEVLAEVRNLAGLRQSKLHLGNIFIEPIINQTTPIEERTTLGLQALRAFLGVFDPTGVAPLASVKMDQLGNIEIVGTPQVMLDAVQIIIGGVSAATMAEPAVKGTALMTWLNSHTHQSGIGPTGMPVIPAIPTDFCSLKIFVA